MKLLLKLVAALGLAALAGVVLADDVELDQRARKAGL
jgi:hypothetical protein